MLPSLEMRVWAIVPRARPIANFQAWTELTVPSSRIHTCSRPFTRHLGLESMLFPRLTHILTANERRPRVSYLAISAQWYLLLFMFAGASLAAAQPATGTPEEFVGLSEPLRVVHVLDEPRHRTVHVDGDVRLLDVQVNPGDNSLPHTHDSAIMYTFINLGRGLDGRVSSITRYVDEPFTHRVSNSGSELFQIIALTSFADPVPDDTLDLPSGLTLAPELENGWFRAWRLTLEVGESYHSVTHINPAFIVQVSEGASQVQRSDSITGELLQPGHWSAVQAGQSYVLHNPSAQPVTVVVKEARASRS